MLYCAMRPAILPHHMTCPISVQRIFMSLRIHPRATVAGGCGPVQVDKVNLRLQLYGATVLQPGVHAMLGQDNYLLFSNHSTDLVGQNVTEGNGRLFASLEVSLIIPTQKK